MNWVQQQIEWFKDFFNEVQGGKASSRRIIELGIAWSFIFSYIRVALSTSAMPALDMGWILLISGILGLKTADIYFKNKATNGNNK